MPARAKKPARASPLALNLPVVAHVCLLMVTIAAPECDHRVIGPVCSCLACMAVNWANWPKLALLREEAARRAARIPLAGEGAGYGGTWG
jgi:hypothetical protein